MFLLLCLSSLLNVMVCFFKLQANYSYYFNHQIYCSSMICILLPWQQGERNTETQKGRSGTLEIQSRSISLSSAMVVLPQRLNEKHFAAEFAVLARNALVFSHGRLHSDS